MNGSAREPGRRPAARRGGGPAAPRAARSPRGLGRAAGLLVALCLALVCGMPSGFAAGPKIRFDHLSRKEGLSQVSVVDILQDRRGFMWFATQDGLNRYDGYEVTVFKHDPNDIGTLSDNLIVFLFEDSEGSIWVVTQQPGVLNRLDPLTGRVRRFVHDAGDPDSLPDVNITQSGLCEVEPGLLWIATAAGLRQVELATGRMRAITNDAGDGASLSSDLVSRIFRDRAGRVWVGTIDAGLNRWLRSVPGQGQNPDANRPRFRHFRYDPDDPQSLPSDAVTAIFEDSAGYLWIGAAAAGVARFDPRSQTFVHYPVGSGQLGGAGVPLVKQPMAEDARGRIWVITGNGLSRIDPRARGSEGSTTGSPGEAGQRRSVVRSFRSGSAGGSGIGSNQVSCVLYDRSGNLWVGTAGGSLNRYDAENERFEIYLADATDPTTFPSAFVATIFESSSGIVWFGTNSAGVSRYSPQRHKIRHYTQEGTSPDWLRDRMIFALFEGSDGSLWVGTMAGGLHRLDQAYERVVERYALLPGDPRDIGGNYVRSVCEDHLGRIWAGVTGAGVALIDPVEGRAIRRFANDPSDSRSLSNNLVQSVFEDSRGQIWVGTASGWNRLEADGGFRRFLNQPGDPASLTNSFARFTFEDSKGRMWIGTLGGLSRFDATTETFTSYAHDLNDPSSLGNNNVMAMVESQDGAFWIATYGGGLDRLDPETGSFSHLTTRDGLPSDSLYGVLLDQSGQLWISSNHGLCRIDPMSDELTGPSPSEALVCFDVDDGLQSNEFNGRAFLVRESGELLFGGVDGFNAFFPGELRSSEYVPPVVLTGLHHMKENVRVDQPVAGSDLVELSYRDRLLTFEFAALDYANPGRNRYAFMLEGLHDEWVDNGSRRAATFSSIDAGRYTFRVRGASGDGVWNDQGASLELVVVPPPWRTAWAYCLYGVLAAGAVFGYVRFKTVSQRRELSQQRTELKQQVAIAERLREVDRLKDEFLANTSHELRTPLNGIIGIAESLLDGVAGRVNDEARANLSMIASSGRRLSHLVDDILDFSQLKNHQIRLLRRAVGLREVVDVVLTLSAPLITGRDLVLRNLVPADLPPADADENRLQQIMHNLVGNAIKFTESGSVEVRAELRQHMLEISVRDTGIGIPADQVETVFESFAQVDASTARAHGGSGLGLTVTRQLVELHGGAARVSSQEGVGSTFYVTLPVWTGEAGDASHSRDRLARIRDLTGGAVAGPGGAEPVTSDAVQRSEEIRSRPDQPEASVVAVGADGPVAPECSASPGHAGTVLVVDDEPINLQVLQNQLSLAGYEVLRAIDGFECLARLDQGSLPDLVLLDVMMPRLTGFETAKRIRRRWSANELPIILVTAKNQVADLVEGLAAGANDYLSKPFSSSELLARVRTHISLARAHDIEAENRRRSRELEHARTIQLAMLPEQPPDVDELDIAVHMETASEVGGDYYDFLTLADGSLLLVTGDATGHGMSAGMMVAMTKAALKAIDPQSPHVMLQQLNGVLCAVNLQRVLMALNAAHINAREIALSSAGMPPAYLYRAESGAVGEVLLSGLPLGVTPEASYELRIVELRPGDALVMISDGLPERLDPSDQLLGYDAVSARIADCGSGSADDIKQSLIELGSAWSRGRPPRDDITIIVIKRVPSSDCCRESEARSAGSCAEHGSPKT